MESSGRSAWKLKKFMNWLNLRIMVKACRWPTFLTSYREPGFMHFLQLHGASPARKIQLLGEWIGCYISEKLSWLLSIRINKIVSLRNWLHVCHWGVKALVATGGKELPSPLTLPLALHLLLCSLYAPYWKQEKSFFLPYQKQEHIPWGQEGNLGPRIE